jgi:Flp pilus assembly protein TadB
MGSSGIRAALVLGIVPIIVGAIYWFLNTSFGTELTRDAAGVTMLISFGLALGFGTFVVVRGATDL